MDVLQGLFETENIFINLIERMVREYHAAFANRLAVEPLSIRSDK